MTNFTDQFNRRDPLTFNATGILNFWPRQIAWDARSLLQEKTTSQMIEMARHIESTILQQVDYLMKSPEPEKFQQFASNPMTISLEQWNSGSPENLRERFGDVNLFVAASDPLHPAGLALALPFEQWEGLAIIALWKLVDFYETMFFWRREQAQRQELHWGKFKMPAEEKAKALSVGSPFLVEAMRACTLAAEGRMRVQQVAALRTDHQRRVSEALYEAEAMRRRDVSEKSRSAVMVRHDKTGEHIARALELANTGKFKSRAAAARHAADIIQKTPGEFYTPDTVDGWLKKAGWKPQKGGSTT